MEYSKSKIDKIGKMLIRPDGVSEDELLDAEIVLDEWRQDFVQPLTDVILKCQELLQNEIPSLYIAQRLNKEIEIQLRTFSQHAWAEEIERTSIICKVQLKEGEGPENALDYFHKTSDTIWWAPLKNV